MATTKITNPELFDLASLDTALKLPSGTTAERPTSPSTGEWRYNTDNNLIEYYDGANWRELQDEEIPPIPSENFNTVLYTGNGSTQSITGVGFQPDWVWIKETSQARNHMVFDSTRGVQKRLHTNTNNTESTLTNGLSSFDADGFSIGSNSNLNTNASEYVAWCWKANGGTTTSGSGTGGTTNVTHQLNSKTGFCITKFTSNNNGGTSGGSTVNHGLDSTPGLIILKSLDTINQNWAIWITGFSGSEFLYLNATDAKQTSVNMFNGVAPDSSKVTLGAWNNQGAAFILYAFKNVAGFSKFGSYTGSSGNQYASVFVSTGFKPSFVMIKQTNTGGANWVIFDNTRANGGFLGEFQLNPNLTSEEYKQNTNPAYVLFTEDGFEVNGNPQSVNGNGASYIYAAFAADPTTTSPTLADSFGIQAYNGDSNTYKDITGYGFAPTLVWAKNRNSGNWHTWKDRIRSSTPYSFLSSNLTNESQGSGINDAISEFLTDGWQASSNWNGSSAGLTNQSGLTYVGWGWKANNDSATRDTSGTIPAIISANQAAGFSIVKYTGTGTNSQTLPHGLGAKPDFVVIKQRNAVTQWVGFTDATGTFSYFYLNTTQAFTAYPSMSYDATYLNLNSGGDQNGAGDQHVAYFFRSIAGYSKIGTYTGNGTTNAITGLGFQPDWILARRTDAADNWAVINSVTNTYFLANLADAEATYTWFAFTSDGFTLSTSTLNQSGGNYIYMAFKENPTPYPLAGNMSFLVVAGGGGGGYWMGAGGGAGGLRTSYGSTSGGGASAESDITLAAGTYTITVGAAGSGMPSGGSTLPSAGNGGDSSIAASGITTITSIAGGGGGAYAILQPSNAVASGANGGSGGGAWSISNQGQSAGTGTAGQGYAGALGGNQTSAYGEGTGGGGGASAAGTQGLNGARPDGGAGLTVNITGSAVDYAGGGGGATTCASPNNATNGGLGGTGGGGNGGYCSAGNDNGGNGTTNTGGGGGGSSAVGTPATSGGTAGNGGSGVVILRLLTSEYSGTTTGSPTVTTDGDYSLLTYTGSGTYVHS